MSSTELPIGLALLPCDTVIEDKFTGKKSLVGIISRITCKALPALLPRMGLMVSLTGGMGTAACEVLCTRPELPRPVFAARGRIRFDHPSQVIEMVFRLERLQFPLAGSYSLRVLVDDVLVMTRPLQVVVLGARSRAGAEGAPPPSEPPPQS